MDGIASTSPAVAHGICVGARILASRTTGVQRYLRELLARLPEIERIAPTKPPLSGSRGHAWEQFCLPTRLHGRLLWSPSNTGPLSVRNQVVTIHDVVPLDHPEWLNRRFAAWYSFLIPRLVRRVQHVITVSAFTRDRLISRCNIEDKKVSVIYNGVDTRFRLQPPDVIIDTRKKLGIPLGRYVLSVGSLEPRKNLRRLLLAWEAILPGLPTDVSLVLAGAKGRSLVFADTPELKALPDRVRMVGYVPDEDLPALYAGAAAFVYPSVYEGFGLPPLEAMACGTPVIVGNCGSLPEVVGEAAVSVDPYDVDAIARALLDVLTVAALADRLRAAGPVRSRKFGWDKAAKETWQVLRAVGGAR